MLEKDGWGVVVVASLSYKKNWVLISPIYGAPWYFKINKEGLLVGAYASGLEISCKLKKKTDSFARKFYKTLK